jgi:hypothetical protein
MEVLEAHIIAGHHEETVESESVYDKIRRQWASHFSTITVEDEDLMGSEKSQLESKTSKQKPHLLMGWALQKPREGHGRYPSELTQYLTTKFDLCEATGQKADGQVRLLLICEKPVMTVVKDYFQEKTG